MADSRGIVETKNFDAFNTTEVTYKTVNDHALKATILVPKNVQSGTSSPLLVHFHGGGFATGDKMFLPWWSKWLIQLAESRNAVIVSPNYRFIPESTMSDILDDLESFWKWVHSTLPSIVSDIAPEIKLSLEKVAVGGESAGGYLSIQSALLFPDAHISIVMPEYGAVDFDHPYYSQSFPKQLLGYPSVPESLMDDYLKNLKPGAIRSSGQVEETWELVLATIRYGLYPKFLGTNEKVYLMKALQTAKSVPAMWVLQGEGDTVVPAECSKIFVDTLKALYPDTPVKFSLEPGEHGFDALSTMEDDWVKEGVEFVGKYWP